MRAFISFSSRDGPFVSKLKARLKAQPIAMWDYSCEGEEIPSGVCIEAFLRDRVSRSDVFIPVVTANSMAAHYCQLEVETAMRDYHRHASPLIIPFVEQSCFAGMEAWDQPFSDLRAHACIRVNISDRRNWEEGVVRFCRALELNYQPLAPEKVLLPFTDRFDTEIEKARPKARAPERFDGIYWRLTEIKNNLIPTLDEADYEQGLFQIDYLLATCAFEFPGHRFYYATITKLICLINLGRMGEAYDLARALLGHPGEDETLLGVMGHILQCRGAHKEAVHYFSRALELDPSDTTAAAGLVINCTLGDDRRDLTAALRVLETGSYPSPAERRQGLVIVAAALLHLDRACEAVGQFGEAIDGSDDDYPDAEGYMWYARALEKVGCPGQAIEVIDRALQHFPSCEVLAMLKAQILLGLGREPEALAAIESGLHACRRPSFELRHHYQSCLAICGRSVRARQDAAALLAEMRLPSSPDEFYFAGLANWLLGRSERARYDFERSGRPNSEFYSL